MQVFRVSFANRFGAFVVQLTNWLVTPLRRVLPGVFGLDLASLLPALLCQALVVTALIGLQGSLAVMEPASLVLLILGQALRATLRMAIYLMIGALIALGGDAARARRALGEAVRRIAGPTGSC